MPSPLAKLLYESPLCPCRSVPLCHTPHPAGLLLGSHTDGASAPTGGLGVLTPDLDAPVMTETAVVADLLQTLQILTQLRVQLRRHQLAVSACFVIFLSVQEPVGHLEGTRVGHHLHQVFDFFLAEFAGTVHPTRKQDRSETTVSRRSA